MKKGGINQSQKNLKIQKSKLDFKSPLSASYLESILGVSKSYINKQFNKAADLGYIYFEKDCRYTGLTDSHIFSITELYEDCGFYAFCFGGHIYTSHPNRCKATLMYKKENRCKDDNPPKTNYQSYYPSSYEFSRKQSNAILGFGSIVGIIPMLSNDIYAFHAYSIKPSDKSFTRYDRFGRTTVPLNITSSEKNYHWVFGFRKTFDNSALEYGVSLSKTTDYFGDDLIYKYTLENKRFTYHLNFLKQLNFINIKNNRFNIYVGPSINYIGSDNIYLISGWDDYNWEDNYSKLGFGGIIGASYKLNHRLKLDTRFEQGTNTNRFQAGLIFTYQKEYIWEF